MSDPAPRRRIALVLEYDGGEYHGSQVQQNAPSIQGELEAALRSLTGECLRAAFAGRTDAGVHARGQVAAFTTASSLDTQVFVRGLNAWLPEDIVVRRAAEVAESFDPRRHAASRSYQYTIYNAVVRSPLWQRRAWHVADPLDVPTMQQAAAVLVGEHDFAAFGQREAADAGRTVRCLRHCEVTQDAPFVTVDLEANAFLRQQARRMTGVLTQVGRGRMTATEVAELLRRAEPGSAGPVAPAHGLALLRVSYPGLDLVGSNPL